MNSVGGFLAGSMTKIYKCRLFAAGYIFSASSPPYSCTAAKDSFEQIEKNGKQMKEKIDKIKNDFYNMSKEISDKIEIIGDKQSPFILLKCENVDNLIEKLKKNGFYVAKQAHLKEDWCQNELIKVNLGNWFTIDNIKSFINVLKNY
jgi:serine palmitoyltransferase